MSRLNMAPETPVRSLDELAAVARAVRKETARRYVEAARQMREHGSTAAAEELEGLYQVPVIRTDEPSRAGRWT